MPKSDVLLVIDSQSSTRNSAGNFVLSSGSSGGGGGVSPTELANYLRRDGTSAMLGNLDMGGFSIANVALLDGIDLPAHVANPDAHHAKIHAYDSIDHTGLLPWDKIDFGNSELIDIRVRPHSALTGIGPNDHHNQVHNIVGTDHTVTGVIYDVVALTANNVLGLLTPSANPGAAIKLLRTDAAGLLVLKRMEGVDYVKSTGGYLQAATYVAAGSYVSAVTYVDTPILQQAGNVSIISGINIALKPTGFVYLDTNRSIRTNSFVSGFAGGGWQIDQNISAPGTNAEFDNLTIRGRMRVYELVIQQIRATNGSIFVSSVAKVKSVTLISGSTYEFVTEDYHGFFLNDLIRAQRFTTAGSGGSVYRCDMRVTSIDATTPLYKFRAVLENAGDVPTVGMDFVRIGNTSDATRRGALYLSSDDSNSPFIDVVNGVDSWTAWTSTAKTKVRIGKITGITSTADEYGLIAGNTGFGDNDAWIKVSNLGIQMNNIPLKFFSYRNSVSSWTGYWSADGNELWLGRNVNDKYFVWHNDVNTGNVSLTVRGNIFVTGGDAATTTAVNNAQTAAINYTNGYAANLSLSNTSVNWAASTSRGGNAIDVIYVNGVQASLVQEYSNRARQGLATTGRVVLSVQSPNLSADAVIGLNLTSQYLGYYNGSTWTNFIKSDGTFRFGSALTGNRIEWNGTQLAGYNTGGALQWYASADNGYILAGGGNVALGDFGISVAGYTFLNQYGLTVIRPTNYIQYTIEPGGPLDYGTYPEAASSIDLQDTSFTASDWYGNTLYYYAQTILRIYVSSKHFVSDDTYFDSDLWKHYLDGVIEVPPLSHWTRTILNPNGKPYPYSQMGLQVQESYYPRLFLRNVYSSIILHRGQQIDVNAQSIYFNFMSSSYDSPQLQTYLRFSIEAGTQYIISNQNLTLQAGGTGTYTAFLKALNVDIGLTATFGEINLYGITNARQYLRLRSWFGDGIYMEFFNRGATPTIRSAWFGFGDGTTTTLSVYNELGTIIYLRAISKVQVSNNLEIGNHILFNKQAGTPAAIPGVVQMYQGGDGNMYFRGPNGYVRITGLTLLSGTFP